MGRGSNIFFFVGYFSIVTYKFQASHYPWSADVYPVNSSMNCTNFSPICQQSTTVCPTLVSVSFITKAACSATAPTLIFPSLRIGFPLLTLIAKTGIVTLGLCECNTSLWKEHRCNIHFGLVIVCVHVLWTGDRLDIQIRRPRIHDFSSLWEISEFPNPACIMCLEKRKTMCGEKLCHFHLHRPIPVSVTSICYQFRHILVENFFFVWRISRRVMNSECTWNYHFPFNFNFERVRIPLFFSQLENFTVYYLVIPSIYHWTVK